MSAPGSKPDANPGGSPKARALSARLSAVQALYQNAQNPEQSLDSLIDDYLHRRAGMEIDGETMLTPDGTLMKKIIRGVAERRDELEAILAAHLKQQGQEKREPEPLLKAVMLAGACELLLHQDIDFPVIINDYLHITHAFYDKVEAGLVNAVLDAAAKVLRS